MVRMRRLSLLLLGATAAMAGCGRKTENTPALSVPAAATGTETAEPAPSASGSADPDEPPMPAQTGPSLVDLEGVAHLPPAVPDNVPRLASIAMLTDVIGPRLTGLLSTIPL